MDLNLLISTIITSTAALIAIIGGFLVSRVISLSSEQNAIKRRLSELRSDLKFNEGLYQKAKTSVIEDNVDDFITENIQELLKPNFDLDEILRGDDAFGVSKKILFPYLEKFRTVKNEMKIILRGSVSKPDSFSEFLHGKRIVLKYPEHTYWYQIIYSELNRYQPQNPGPFNIPSTFLQHAPISTSNNPSQKYRDLQNEESRLSGLVESLRAQIAEHEKILKDYGKPAGIWGGIIVLIYACIVGIIYPTTLLPYPFEENFYDDSLTKWFLISLFISELLALFIYLIWNMFKLTRNFKAE